MANEPTYQEKAKRRPKKKSKEGWTKKKARAVDVAIRKMLVDNEDEGVALEELNAKLSEKERLGPAEFKALREQALGFSKGRLGERHDEKEPTDLYAENLAAGRSHKGRRPQNPSEPLTYRVTVRISERDMKGLEAFLKRGPKEIQKVQKQLEEERGKPLTEEVRLYKRLVEPDKKELELTPPFVMRALLWWISRPGRADLSREILRDYAKHVLKGRLAEHATRKKREDS